MAAIAIGVVFALRDGQPAAAPVTGDGGTDVVVGETDVTQDADATQPTQEQGQTQEAVDLSSAERHDSADVLAFGSPDAPVTVIAFSDYQCGYCARWSADTFPVIMEYVDAGQVRLEWRDINIFGADSERAARATYAAALQGAFAEYHQGLFPGGSTRGASALTDEALIALAGELGLDTEQFAADLAAPETAAEVARNQELGASLGVYSTPSFVIAGKPLVGAQPTEVFVAEIAAALAG